MSATQVDPKLAAVIEELRDRIPRMTAAEFAAAWNLGRDLQRLGGRRGWQIKSNPALLLKALDLVQRDA
jgi:hypothetical protein